MSKYRIVWQDTKKHNKVFKGDWISKELLDQFKRDSLPRLGKNITNIEFQKKGV